MAKKKSQAKSKRQQPADDAKPLEEVLKNPDWFDQLINPPLDKFKNELQYDAKVWLAERENDENLKEPFDLMITFALVCARHVTAILLLLRDLKVLCESGRSSFTERWMLCSGLYVLSAVNQRLRNLPDDEWELWPETGESHCFGSYDLSTLLALDVFCTKVEVAAFERVFQWIWSITGSKVDCDLILRVIENAVKDAGILNFVLWSAKFNFNLFMYSDLFPGAGDVRFLDEIISDEYDPEAELDRVISQLEFEHHKAKASLAKGENGKMKRKKAEAKRRKKKSPAAQQKQSPAMSLPLGLQKWATILGVSVGTVRTWKNDPKSKYHFQSVSAKSRKWRLPLNDLPAEYLERYKKSVS